MKTIAQLFGKGLVGDAEGYRAIFAQQVRCQVNRLVKDDRCGFDGHIEQVPCHIRHVSDIALKASGRFLSSACFIILIHQSKSAE